MLLVDRAALNQNPSIPKCQVKRGYRWRSVSASVAAGRSNTHRDLLDPDGSSCAALPDARRAVRPGVFKAPLRAAPWPLVRTSGPRPPARRRPAPGQHKASGGDLGLQDGWLSRHRRPRRSRHGTCPPGQGRTAGLALHLDREDRTRVHEVWANGDGIAEAATGCQATDWLYESEGDPTITFDTMNQPTLTAMGRFEWEHIIRRLVVPPERRAVKLVAMMLASFADSTTGERVRPGEKRLASMCQLGRSTVRASLKYLRDEGLIYRRSRGSNLGHANYVDVYVLCAPHDWERRFPLLPASGKDEENLLIVRPRRGNPNPARSSPGTANQ